MLNPLRLSATIQTGAAACQPDWGCNQELGAYRLAML